MKQARRGRYQHWLAVWVIGSCSLAASSWLVAFLESGEVELASCVISDVRMPVMGGVPKTRSVI